MSTILPNQMKSNENYEQESQKEYLSLVSSLKFLKNDLTDEDSTKTGAINCLIKFF